MLGNIEKAKAALESCDGWPVNGTTDMALLAIANALVAIAEREPTLEPIEGESRWHDASGGECETCHAESDLSEWVCSECQCWIPLGLTPENIGRASEWRYCPHCGRKVKVVD